MEFHIHRTSDYNYAKPVGVDNTHKKMLTFYDGSPYKEGEFLEINSLEELMNLIKKLGSEVIIKEHGTWPKGPEIEIYDDYRE